VTNDFTFDFAVITGKTIHRIIHGNMPECLRIVREAYLTHDAGQSINPNSYFLRYPEKPSARIIALPAHLGGATSVSGIKWIASFPENVAKGFPRASAVLVLNSYETGYPFACLESSIISAARTAASAVVAADVLRGGRRCVKTLGIVGNGLIARYVYDFLVGTGWDIGSIALFDTNPAESTRFASEVCDAKRHAKIATCVDVESLIEASEVIVLTTIASKPHITDFALFAHNPLVLHLSLRDLSPEILLKSNNVVDDVDHVMNAGTSPHLAEQMSGGRGFVSGTIAGAIARRYVVDPSRPTILSPFGLGILDLAVGKWVYDAAHASGEAIRVDDFFHEIRR
jgi:N-[(2S)-2-amino-2-carboxyethyl]-L-glutamate dehydrogenase